MKSVVDFFKLIRFPNLCIIALSQILMRYCIVKPMLSINGFYLQLSRIDFIYLVMSTCMIAAAGYIINDYFDIKIDSINKPTVIIGRSIKRRWAMVWHLVFNFVAFILMISLGYRVGNYKLGFIFILAAGLLWYYSTNFKKQFIVGNVVVALLTAMAPLLVGLFELPLLYYTYGQIMKDAGTNFNFLAYFILAFSFFAFLTTMLREIIKDAEDIEGDTEYGCETIPIKLGISKTKIVLIGLVVVLMSALGYVQYRQYTAADMQSFSYILIVLQLPYVFMIYKIWKSEVKKDFHFLSQFNKVLMLGGLLFSLLIAYQFNKAANEPPPVEEMPQVQIGGGVAE